MKHTITQNRSLIRVVESRNAPTGGVAGLLLLSMTGTVEACCCCNCNCNCCTIAV